MDLSDISWCGKCGVLYNSEKCRIKEAVYYHGEKEESGEVKCPVCGHIMITD